MALETVEITVQDDQIVPQLVDGVVARVFDETGTTFITEATTGSVLPGKVQVTLNGDDPPIRYQLRFYITGGSILSPQYIDVYSPPAASPTGANNFLITASVFTLPVAVNPYLCRASGYVWGPDGRPRRGIDIAFVPLFRPLVVNGIGVLGERVNVKTDKNGYVQVDLLRDGMYYATVESHENVLREVAVPDRSSINIMHLLFPIVVAIDYGVASVSVAVNGLTTLTPQVQASDFRVLEGSGSEDVQYSVDNPAVASVLVSPDNVVINGLSPGNTSLRVTRKDSSIIYIPDPGIDGAVLPITVT
jgi:hypothetical protein